MAVATRDDDLVPCCMRAMGARVHADRRGIDLLLPLSALEKNRENLERTGEVAASFSVPLTSRTFQLKGKVRRLREGDESDRVVAERYRQALARALDEVGMPPALTLRLSCWPCLVVEVEVRDVFDQTPGPGAGGPVAGGGRGEERDRRGTP